MRVEKRLARPPTITSTTSQAGLSPVNTAESKILPPEEEEDSQPLQAPSENREAASGSAFRMPNSASHSSTLRGLAVGFSLPCAALAAYIGSPWRWFSWHPLLMMLAFIAAAGSGVLTKQKGGRENTITHGYCMLFALLLSLGGWYVIYQYVCRSARIHSSTRTYPSSDTWLRTHPQAKDHARQAP